jgi:hypothetical protein
MSEKGGTPKSEQRPRVTGFFVEPDEEGIPLSMAIGRAVVGAAALESALRLEAARLLHLKHAAREDASDSTLLKELAGLDELTAGGLLRKLKELGMPADLKPRIKDAIDRRNDLVHRTFEDPELARAITKKESVEAVVQRIERLALDCGELAVELEMFAIPKALKLTGRSLEEVVVLVTAQDPRTITDPRERKQLEAVLALAESEDLITMFRDLGITRELD